MVPELVEGNKRKAITPSLASLNLQFKEASEGVWSLIYLYPSTSSGTTRLIQINAT